MARSRILPTRRELSNENRRLNASIMMFDTYLRVIKVIAHPEELAKLVETYTNDKLLTGNQKEALNAFADRKDFELRPKLQAPSVHSETAVPSTEDNV